MSMQNKKLYRVFWRVKEHTMLKVKNGIYHDKKTAQQVVGTMMRHSNIHQAWVEEIVPVSNE